MPHFCECGSTYSRFDEKTGLYLCIECGGEFQHEDEYDDDEGRCPDCPHCGGTGLDIDDTLCPECDGEGIKYWLC